MWEVQAARARGVARPFLQLTNLTESRYEEIRDAVMSGRTVRGSVELSAARR